MLSCIFPDFSLIFWFDCVVEVAFVLKILLGVTAGWGEDDLIVGCTDGGGGLFVLKMLLGDESFPSFWFCALFVLIIFGWLSFVVSFSAPSKFFSFWTSWILVINILKSLTISSNSGLMFGFYNKNIGF